MNKTQIKTIKKFIVDVEAIKPNIESLLEEVREIQEKLQDFINGAEEELDSKSEKWQESDKGQEFSESIIALNSALESVGALETSLSSAENDIDFVVQELDNAKGMNDDE